MREAGCLCPSLGLGVPRGVILQPSPCGLSSRREALHPRAPAPSQETLSS